MSEQLDRRPWLILSRSEALALRQAALWGNQKGQPVNPVLERAVRVIDKQLRWIDGEEGEQPSIRTALAREAEP